MILHEESVPEKSSLVVKHLFLFCGRPVYTRKLHKTRPVVPCTSLVQWTFQFHWRPQKFSHLKFLLLRENEPNKGNGDHLLKHQSRTSGTGNSHELFCSTEMDSHFTAWNTVLFQNETNWPWNIKQDSKHYSSSRVTADLLLVTTS